jgi:hypothetical protein
MDGFGFVIEDWVGGRDPHCTLYRAVVTWEEVDSA